MARPEKAIMNKIIFITTIVGGIIVIVKFFQKELSKKRKIQIFLSTVFIACLIPFFNSDFYKHFRNYDEKNFCITAKPLPLVLKRGNQLYYKHCLWIMSCYPKDLVIENISININSEGPISDSEILLADLKEKAIKFNLSIEIDSLKKEEHVIISLSSRTWLKEPDDVDIRMMVRSINIYAEYEFLSKNHKKSLFVNPPFPGSMPKKVLYKDNVIFEKIIALDHRKLPHLFDKYPYYEELFDNDTKLIRVFCDSQKFIHIYYSGHGKLEYKSDEKISKPTDIVRLLVFKDGYFFSDATFLKHQIKSE